MGSFTKNCYKHGYWAASAPSSKKEQEDVYQMDYCQVTKATHPSGKVLYIYICRYPKATKFNGFKIVVLNKWIGAYPKSLDPHFIEGGDVVARFSPEDDSMRLFFADWKLEDVVGETQ